MRTDSGMRPHMARKTPLLGKCFRTLLALKGTSLVDNLVHMTRNLLRQIVHLHELTSAQAKFVGILYKQEVVYLVHFHYV
jgi:hypothetical protein